MSERQDWVRAQFQKANQYLASKGIMPNNVMINSSRYLAPVMAVWKMRAVEAGVERDYWVITGEVPTDHIDGSAAANARDVVRYFSLTWQMRAEQLRPLAQTDETQRRFADMLVQRATELYQLYEKDDLWQQAELPVTNN